jgi:UDP-N-acetylglucosamine 2-epimerase (non-hydrolysing)
MLKVLTIVGTRPEIIRLSCIINKFNNYFDHKLIHTGQNYDYELNKIFFDQLDIQKPDFFLDCQGVSPAENMASIIANTDKILSQLNPDAVVILGDTNSALAAIAAKRRKIPIFHLEAGNRCYDQRVPEEINRKIVDHISDINLTYSNIARDNLLRENLDPFKIIKIGSPLLEVINANKDKIEKSKILSNLSLQENNYFVISVHREENIDNPINFKKIINIINSLAKRYQLKIIFSVHPRTKKKIDSDKIKFNKLVIISKPFGFHDYAKLQINAKVVISDSGSITEESSILNFPALNLRETHERQEGMEEGAVIMTNLSLNNVIQGIEILKYQERGANRNINIVEDYNKNNISEKMIRIVLSYTDYINESTWKKNKE